MDYKSSQSMRPLPKGVERADFTSVPKVIVESIVNGPWPVYLCGDAGRGKTFIAASAYVACPANHVLWIDFQRWSKEIMKARQGLGEIREAWELRKVEESRLVCIDDCGLKSDSEAQSGLLLEVLNLRQGKPTIVTCNHEPIALPRVFDSRVTSRLLSGSIIKLVGPDRRMQGKKIIEVEV
jgi:DNA replication protein DnaC